MSERDESEPATLKAERDEAVTSMRPFEELYNEALDERNETEAAAIRTHRRLDAMKAAAEYADGQERALLVEREIYRQHAATMEAERDEARKLAELHRGRLLGHLPAEKGRLPALPWEADDE